MMSSAFKLFCLVALLHTSSAIRCFICQSRSNPHCHDPIQSYQLQLTECTPDVMQHSSRELGRALNGLGGLGNHLGMDWLSPPISYGHSPFYCQKISFNVGDERVVVRGCQPAASWAGEPRTVCRLLEDQSKMAPGTYINYCGTCDNDACNGTHSKRHASPLLTLLVVFLLAVRLR